MPPHDAAQPRGSPPRGSPASAPVPPPPPASTGKGALYGIGGMLRKTTKRTYSALRGGGRRSSIGAARGRAPSADSDSSSESGSSVPRGGAANGTIARGSPFATPCVGNGGGRGGGDSDIAAARSFYFSPLNSWQDGHQHLNGVGRRHHFQNPTNPSASVPQTLVGSEPTEDAVKIVERILRQVVVCCVMFIAGTKYGDYAPSAHHLLELSVAGWGTCLLIAALGWIEGCRRRRSDGAQFPRERQFQALYTQQQLQELRGYGVADTAARLDATATPMMSNRKARDNEAAIGPPQIERLEQEHEISRKRSHDDVIEHTKDEGGGAAEGAPPPKVARDAKRDSIAQPTGEEEISAPADRKDQRQVQRQHPHLENLYVMMVNTQERIVPNSVAVDIDSDLFHGKMLLMFRTPDSDSEALSGYADPYASYFRGKQRRFEFQWQLRLKKVPRGDVFLAAEVEEPIQMGMIQRAVANAALKFVRKMNQGFSYHFSDTPDERSYLSFPVGTSMDRFNATRVGDVDSALPVLGKEVPEDPEAMRQRKKGARIEWRTDHVYTMALWSAYLDWSDWRMLNFPGIRPFSITSMVGVQPIQFTLYTTCSRPDGEEGERNKIVEMEVSNSAKATLGREAKKWVALNSSRSAAEVAATAADDTYKPMLSEVAETIDESSEVDSLNDNATFDEEDDDDEEIDEQFDDDDKSEEDMEEDEEDEDEALELESPENSCYLLSGTPVSLREGTGSFVASGGGYAVLQSSPTTSIVLERFQKKKRRKKKLGQSIGPSNMIRSGDVVRVKLVDAASKSVKHLVIHRGWWLRWSSARPKRNGLFTVRAPGEPNGSLVVLGCPFSLVSRRWSHYVVGACHDASAKYGGRMLGIHKASNSRVVDDTGGDAEDDNRQFIQDNEVDDSKDIARDKRMMPLLLCAEVHHSSAADVDYSSPLKSPTRAPRPSLPSEDNLPPLPLTTTPESHAQKKRYEIDVPAWLEVMNRTSRTKMLVYGVRVKESEIDSGTSDDGECQQKASTRSFVKLRTGRELAPILRMGVEFKQQLSPERFDFNNQDDDDADSFTSSSDESDSDADLDEELDEDDEEVLLIAGPNHGADATFSSDQGDYAPIFSLDDDDNAEEEQTATGAADPLTPSAVEEESCAIVDGDKPTRKGKGNAKRLSTKMKREKSFESVKELFSRQETQDELKRGESSVSAPEQIDLDRAVGTGETKKKGRKHAALIGRVAKTVTKSTVITGKHVAKHSKNIGKGTVYATVYAGRAAGRALPVSYKPPRKHEPGGRVARDRKSDNRNLKEIGKTIKNIEGLHFSTSLLSGQLLAPDQSCRKVSKILSDISSAPGSQDAISLLATTNSIQDLAFLRGSSAELGVKALRPVDAKSDEFVIARCIYEGRWREELCVLYAKEQHIMFFAPLAKRPSLAVSFDEIISARFCEETPLCPLPGLYTLAIDTAWKCHYLTFLEHAQRESFLRTLNDALIKVESGVDSKQARKVAPQFESYRLSFEASLTGTAGKWRSVSTGKKSKHKRQRRILNGRRMAFDLAPIASEADKKTGIHEQVASYVENLLRMALGFSPDTLDATDPVFSQFLDETARMRTLPLHEIDLSSREAFCIFVNLYHCLLQHSLLLAVDGLPNKRSVNHFKRCSCYEIGEDVFSLAELESCVIRGNTSRPRHIKPPFVDAPKQSRPYRLMYALSETDFRVNFILNNGDMSYPTAVPILQQQIMDDQIDAAASLFLMDQVTIDKRKRTVYLPKVCDHYRNDFGMGDGLVCLSQCLIYLDESSQLAIAALLEDGVVSVKFQRVVNSFHPNLMESC